jgi:hypothetical protein
MVQNYLVMGLSEDNLRSVLRSSGFQHVNLSYRWFCREESFRAEHGAGAAEQIAGYLTDMLPLTRHLFKYFVLTAK